MAKRIQGITIELDGETKGLDKALKDVNRRSIDLQNELRDVDRLLKFDPGNTEAIAQKQKLLADQVQNSTDKLEQLRNAEKQVQDQFKRGDIKEEQYRAFKREIQFTERELDGFKNKLKKLDDGKEIPNLEKDMKGFKKETKKAEGAVGDLGSELGGLAGGLAAGLGAGFAIDQALDMSSLDTTIDISFDVFEESKDDVKQAIKEINTYGVEAEEAIEGVRRQWTLNRDATNEANRKIVEGAATISKSYAGIDFTELIQEVNEISNQLDITNEEALGLTDALMKMGFPPEQIDIIAEYGKQLHDAGYNAEEIQGIFQAGVNTGTWNIDNLLDGLKEGRVRLSEFGDEVPEAVDDLIEGTDISAKQLQQWGKDIAKGGEDGKEAMRDVAEALNGVDDETKKNLLGVQFFGTMYEDQGQNIIDTLLDAEQQTVNLRDNQDQLNESVERLNQDPVIQFKEAMNQLKEVAKPLLEVVADVISKVSEWIAENPKLTVALMTFAAVIGTVLGVLMGLAPIIFSIMNIAKLLGTVFAAVSAGPIALIIAAIAALIAIGVYLWKNWDELSANARKIFSALGTWLSNKWSEIKQRVVSWVLQMAANVGQRFQEMRNNISQKMQNARQAISDAWENIKSKFTETLGNIWTTVKQKFDDIVSSIGKKMNDAWDKVEDIWDNIQGFFEGIDLFDIGSDIIQGLINGMGSLAGKVWDKAEEIAGSIKDAAKNILGIASPSKEMRRIGEWTGQGLLQGLQKMANPVANMSKKLADNVVNPMKEATEKLFQFEGNNPLSKYFNAIIEDGDYMNDWITHLPKTIRKQLMEVGKQFAQFEGIKENFDAMANQSSQRMREPEQQDLGSLVQAISDLAGRDVVLSINDREFARATGPAMSQQLQGQKVNAARRRGVR